MAESVKRFLWRKRREDLLMALPRKFERALFFGMSSSAWNGIFYGLLKAGDYVCVDGVWDRVISETKNSVITEGGLIVPYTKIAPTGFRYRKPSLLRPVAITLGVSVFMGFLAIAVSIYISRPQALEPALHEPLPAVEFRGPPSETQASKPARESR